MKVFKWGGGLAFRLPKSVVEALKLRAGDEVEVRVVGERAFDIAHDADRAMKRIKALRKDLPAGWKFDRSDANAR